MSFKEFLQCLESYSRVDLVGPLLPSGSVIHSPVIYIDGGLHFKNSVEPHFSLGDGDSSPFTPELLLPRDKNESDLTYALKHLPQHLNQIHLKGFLGGRKDHELMNFAEVHQFLSGRQNCAALFDESILALSSGVWPQEHHGRFSLFAFEIGEFKVQGKIRFPLISKGLKALSSHGVSNEAFGAFEIRCDRPLFLFF